MSEVFSVDSLAEFGSNPSPSVYRVFFSTITASPFKRRVFLGDGVSSSVRLMLVVILYRSGSVIVLKQVARGRISGYSIGDSVGS